MSIFPGALMSCLLSKTEIFICRISHIAIALFISLKILARHHVIFTTAKALPSLSKSHLQNANSILLTGFGFPSGGTADGPTLSLLWNILQRFQEDQLELHDFGPCNFPMPYDAFCFALPGIVSRVFV